MAIFKQKVNKGGQETVSHHVIAYLPPIQNKSGPQNIRVQIYEYQDKQARIDKLPHLNTASYSLVVTKAEMLDPQYSDTLEYLYAKLMALPAFAGGTLA